MLDLRSNASPAEHTQLLRTEEAAKLIGMSASWLTKRRLYGGGPLWVKTSSRAVRYRRADLLAFIAERPSFRTTTEADATTPSASNRVASV